MSDDLPVPQREQRPEVRVSDAERDRAVSFLRDHCTDGRLTLDEFSDRVGVVYGARTAGEIEQVTYDLPALSNAGTLSPPAAQSTATPTRRSQAVKWVVSVFGGNQQKGRWRIEGETTAISVMGSCHLDLRQAEVIGHEAIINAWSLMGSVDVVVPEGIDVVLEGFSLFGGKTARIKDVPVIPGSPVIRVRAFAFMGGVSVRSKGPSTGESRPSRPRPSHRDHRDHRDQRDRARQLRNEMRQQVRDTRRSVRDDMRQMRDLQPDWSPGPPRAPHAPPAVIPPLPPRVRGIDAVAADVANEWPAVRAQVAPEGTVTIMFSDIEGFTSLCERLGDYKANELLREHYRLVRDELARHGGFEVKVHGDGFMVAFSSASRGLKCAQSIQLAQQRWNRENPAEPLRVRMGLHTGEAIRDADDFLGTTVNLASRIAATARGDEILVSGLLRELCVSSGEFEFDSGTEVELKGISQPHRVYQVRYR